MKSDNPLLEPQREKAGPQTFGKYSYQYHWALERAIIEHKKSNEYAIFIELHEDVVFSSSLCKKDATFEFNQVKTNQSNITTNKVVALKNKKSILGKLLESTENKIYSNLIKEINLVSVNGFSFNLKEKDYMFEKINISDLTDDDVNIISSKLNKEIADLNLPTTLNFVIPQLKVENHQDVLIGKIATLISEMFNNSVCDPVNIYRLLIDELYRKGQNVFDYKFWEDSLEKKALTSQKVTETINKYTSHKDDNKIEIDFQNICEELNLKVIERKTLYKALIRYKNKVFGTRSLLQIKTSKSISELIEKELLNSNNEITILISNVLNSLESDIKQYFDSDLDIKGAIIYEYITS